MTKEKIPKEVYNFISNAEYHLKASLTLDARQYIADRIYILLIALENISIADKIYRHWVDGTKIPDAYFKKHSLKLDRVRNPIIRIQFDKKKRTAKEIHYTSPKQLEKILNDLRYGPGKGAESIQEYTKNNRWFDDELRKEVVNRLRWTKLSVELSEKFLREEFE